MNDTRSLFPDVEDQFSPTPDRPDPVIWVRRLAIYHKSEAEVTEIRVVSFRRGVNIIATAAPDEDTDGPVGHNVGKTLLTRLIRYCLGETHYAREPVRQRLQSELPDSYAAAEVCINGVWWVAIRPLGADRPAASKCVQAENWRAALEPTVELQPHTAFVQALQDATVSGFSETLLPHQGRPVHWPDLLAWLSRDQYCRYRNPLEWRSSFVESGTPDLHNEDASVLIRLVMDLLDDCEANLIQEHRRLLKAKRETEAEVRKLEADLDRSRQFLTGRLHMPDDALTNDLFGAAARTTAEIRTKELERLADAVADTLGLPALAEQLEAAKLSVARKEQEVVTEKNRGELLAQEIDLNRKSSDAEIKAQLAKLAVPCPRPVGECPLKGDGTALSSRDEFRKAQIETKTRELQVSEHALGRLSDELSTLISARDAAKREYESAMAKAEGQRTSIRTRIAQLEALIEEAKDYQSENKRLEKALNTLADLERKIDASRSSHHDAHQQLLSRQQTLNRHLGRVAQALVGSPGNATVDVSMRGIHISLDRHDSAQGEALASETALSLDLACLSASICGLGTVPRFFIHDSPREADLEPHIYARLFRFLKTLEESFGDREPSFQYIVTTTTPPPKELREEPYTRLTLDARCPDGLLLRRQF